MRSQRSGDSARFALKPKFPKARKTRTPGRIGTDNQQSLPRQADHPGSSFMLEGADEVSVFVSAWPVEQPRAVVQISHGMGENGGRYAALAAALNAAGYAVYAGDHRGHGRTVGDTPAGPLRQGYAGPDALNGMGRDLVKVAAEIRRRHPGAPVVLLGHSMGSFLARKLMADRPAEYAGFILTGIGGERAALPLKLGGALAAAEARLLSPAFASLALNALVFGPFGRGFKPRRTRFDWLSRDEEAVDQFARHYGQTLFSCGFYRDFFQLLLELQQPESIRRIDPEAPVLLCCGELDPVGGAEALESLKNAYEQRGLADLDCRLYREARHELVFETNRDEVIADWIVWLDGHFPAAEK
ncbi:alpha/beta fold hydrolase [Saccharibacillus qingshengii]|uniref:alpha/beta fold hydrolase n=1 Tax=Saccharibacillus qingshengii TaxID=1763540 RepID=UPI00155413BC|nr:alpha/beta hydrolase [Saccharibacillus qingshengii]